MVLLCSSNWYCLFLLLCANVGKLELLSSGFALLFKLVLSLSFALCKCAKTRGFFKFHSISRCFSFNVFFVCNFFLKFILWFVVCKANKHNYSNTHLFTKNIIIIIIIIFCILHFF